MSVFDIEPDEGDGQVKANTSTYYLVGPDGKLKGFAPPLLGADVVRRWPAARDNGGKLYAFHDNAWRADGTAWYRRQIREIMGERWRPAHSNDTLTWIEDGAGQLDERPPLNLIRVANGILDLTAGTPELLPASALPMTPVHLPVSYDPTATCPQFEQFISSTLPPDLAQIAQEIMGYLLVPDNSQQKAFLFHGEGGNGKSTWIKIQTALLGKENCASYSLHHLAPEYRFNTANLYGKLANMAADISSDELSSSATFRAITGGDAIPAEHKNRQPFTFTPYVRMIFSANKFPPIANPTNALFDRWIVIPFEGRFRGTSAEVPDLHEVIIGTELPGVLNYALAGLARLRANGRFSGAETADRALAAFRLQADAIAAFLREEGEDGDPLFKPGTFYKMKDVWTAYEVWLSGSGHTKGLGKQAFNERVRALWGLETKRSGYNGWTARLLENSP